MVGEARDPTALAVDVSKTAARVPVRSASPLTWSEGSDHVGASRSCVRVDETTAPIPRDAVGLLTGVSA